MCRVRSFTWQLSSAGFHKLLSVYWPNFIVGIIILLIGIPIVMWLSSSRKNAIYAFAAGLWILAGLVLFGLARHVVRTTESNNTSHLNDQITKINTPDISKSDPTASPTIPETKKLPTPNQEKLAMSDEKPKQTNQKQENISANTNAQAGRDVNIYDAPAPAAKSVSGITDQLAIEMVNILRATSERRVFFIHPSDAKIPLFAQDIKKLFAASRLAVRVPNARRVSGSWDHLLRT